MLPPISQLRRNASRVPPVTVIAPNLVDNTSVSGYYRVMTNTIFPDCYGTLCSLATRGGMAGESTAIRVLSQGRRNFAPPA